MENQFRKIRCLLMNEYNKNIGNRIRELRELSDITIKEIAETIL